MEEVKLTVAARSDVGRVRKNNEDAFAVVDLATGVRLEAGALAALDVRDKGVLLALSDGMGGHQAGEVASALVLDSLQTAMQTSAATGSIEQRIEDAVRRANKDVARAAKAENKRGMGATLTAVFVCAGDAFVAEVGDSRAYLLRTGRLRQITRDQSLVQMLVDHGILSVEDAKRSPQKNIILQAMGLADDVRVAIGRLRLRRGDRILICSDGLSNALSDDQMRELLMDRDPGIACKHLIEQGNESGGEDNLTAIVAHLEGAGLERPRAEESVTGTFQVLRTFGDEPAVPEAEPAKPIEPTTPAAEVASVAEALPVQPDEVPAKAEEVVSAPMEKASRPGPSRVLVVVAATVAALLLGAYVFVRCDGG